MKREAFILLRVGIIEIIITEAENPVSSRKPAEECSCECY